MNCLLWPRIQCLTIHRWIVKIIASVQGYSLVSLILQGSLYSKTPRECQILLSPPCLRFLHIFCMHGVYRGGGMQLGRTYLIFRYIGRHTKMGGREVIKIGGFASRLPPQTLKKWPRSSPITSPRRVSLNPLTPPTRISRISLRIQKTTVQMMNCLFYARIWSSTI